LEVRHHSVQIYSGAGELASLSMLDAMRQALLKIRANVPATLPSRVMDERGRTFAGDWQAYCLNDTD
jgi:hypothetical protein